MHSAVRSHEAVAVKAGYYIWDCLLRALTCLLRVLWHMFAGKETRGEDGGRIVESYHLHCGILYIR